MFQNIIKHFYSTSESSSLASETVFSLRQSMSASHLQYDVQDNPAVLQLHLFVAQRLLDLHVQVTIFKKLGGAMVMRPY